jgi:hypothetical protein
MGHNLLENIGDIKVCTGFKLLNVKGPIIILFGTWRHVGFSPRRDGR